MPKGDAARGKADPDDGYAIIARPLLEALACAPLTGAEFQIVFFIMRRTYGWANANNPDRGKIDVMTAKDVATGTGMPKRTAEKALGTLVSENVIVRIPLEDHLGSLCAYGINTRFSEWYGGPEWREAKVSIKVAREADSYTQNSVVPIPEKAYRQYAEKCSEHTQNSVLSGAASACATGADEAPTSESYNESYREREESPPPLARNGSGMKREHANMTLCNFTVLAAKVRAVYGNHWSQAECNDFTVDAAFGIETPGCTITENEAVAALDDDVTRPEVGTKGDWWIGKLDRDKRRAKPKTPKRLSNDPEKDRSIFNEGPLA